MLTDGRSASEKERNLIATRPATVQMQQADQRHAQSNFRWTRLAPKGPVVGHDFHRGPSAWTEVWPTSQSLAR